MTRTGEREITKKENVNGGAGYVLMEALLNEEERAEHCRIFSQVTIHPGCELGYHEHHGETETYYVLSGCATYIDNDKEYEIKVIGYAATDMNSGFQVKLPEELEKYFKNENGPHITVSIREVDGVKGKAYETGLLNFNRIKNPFIILGKLGYYIYEKGKIMDNSIFLQNIK